MTAVKRFLRRAAVQALSAVLRPVYSGIGSIVGLHRVVARAERPRIASNVALELSPESLESLIRHLLARGFAIVSLDEVHAILTSGNKTRRFVAFTFDDGYLDTLALAHPIFHKYQLPFAVNITTSFVANPANVWWYRLETLLWEKDAITFVHQDREHIWDTTSPERKNIAFDQLTQIVRSLGAPERDAFLSALFAVNPAPPAHDRLIMNWDEIRQLAVEDRVTVGAHSVNHVDFNRLTDADVLFELKESRRLIESKVGRKVEHFAYPFGGRNAVGQREFALARQCSFKTAVTTRNANLFPNHAGHLESLPRLSLSGNYPTVNRFDLLQSGVRAAIDYQFKRLVTD